MTRPPVAEELDLLTLDEAAAYVGVSPKTLQAWRDAGRIRERRLGRRVWIAREDLRALADAA